MNKMEGGGIVWLQDIEMLKVDDFKCMKPAVQYSGESAMEMKKSVQERWRDWSNRSD